MPRQQTTSVMPTQLIDQVYVLIERMILDGTLPSGTPLRVRDLAQQVDTSVMPVRDAIRRLEEAGLAERIPYKGALVKTFTVEELIHIYDVRALLEVEAARRGAPHITKREAQKLGTIVRKLHKAVDAEDVVLALDLDEELLRAIYTAAGNPILLSTIEKLWLQCRPYKVIGAREAIRQNDRSLWIPQEQLVQAVRDGDIEKVVQVTSDSVESARLRLESRLTEEDQDNPLAAR